MSWMKPLQIYKQSEIVVAAIVVVVIVAQMCARSAWSKAGLIFYHVYILYSTSSNAYMCEVKECTLSLWLLLLYLFIFHFSFCFWLSRYGIRNLCNRVQHSFYSHRRLRDWDSTSNADNPHKKQENVIIFDDLVWPSINTLLEMEMGTWCWCCSFTSYFASVIVVKYDLFMLLKCDRRLKPFWHCFNIEMKILLH